MSGIVQWDFQNPEMEVPYKAIFCGDVPLNSPSMAIEYTYSNYSWIYLLLGTILWENGTKKMIMEYKGVPKSSGIPKSPFWGGNLDGNITGTLGFYRDLGGS